MNAKICSSVVTVAAILFFATGVRADDEGRPFDNGSVRGDYGFSFSGSARIPVSPQNPQQLVQVDVAAAGRFHSDGNGNVTEGLRTISINGMTYTQNFVCTYQIQADGTGTAECTTLQTGLVDTFFLVLNTKGREFDFVITTPGAIVAGVAKKQ